MTTGRQKCDLLRSIRQQLAIEYGLDYTPAECHHVGDCPGTCPVCDAELANLQRQLDERGITEVAEKIDIRSAITTIDPDEEYHDLKVSPVPCRVDGMQRLRTSPRESFLMTCCCKEKSCRQIILTAINLFFIAPSMQQNKIILPFSLRIRLIMPNFVI